MAKNKKKNQRKEIGSPQVFEALRECKGDVVGWVTDHTTKKGKAKNLSKNKVKQLKTICQHSRAIHSRNRRKLRHYIRVNDKNECYCRICNKKFRSTFYKVDEVLNRVRALDEVFTQAAFLNTVLGGGEKAAFWIATVEAAIGTFPNLYGKLTKAASKRNKAKNQNHKKEKKEKQDYGWWDTY